MIDVSLTAITLTGQNDNIIPKKSQMDNTATNTLISAAIPVAGSLRKLAGLLDMEPANLSKMKKGERPANWRVRGKLLTILGEPPARAFMIAVADDLEHSENEDEKKAALDLRAALADIQKIGIWRKR